MLDNILNVAKEYLQEAVANNAQVPAKQQKSVTDSILSGLESSVTGQLGKNFDIGSLVGLFTGGQQSDFYKDTHSSILDTLVQKTGLNPGVAQSIVSAVLPGLISAITKKEGSNLAGGLLGNLLGKIGL
ncbi:hypothetical protein AGMMS50262_12350 [Bacteroidia bacterium]|nr:hypothetical protein AGMMS50262_12350 [Bacteroidia bacterium]